MKWTLWKKSLIVKGVVVLVAILISGSVFAQTYRKPLPGLPVSFDPKYYSDAYSILICAQIFDRLFVFDELQDIKPNLAERWESSDGGRVWTIYLKRGITFHNGKPFTAEDVEFTLLRLLETDSIKNRELSVIKGAEDYTKKRSKVVSGIKVLSPDSIRIELKTPFPLFLAILTATNMEILPKNLNDQTSGDFFKSPIGTGPFKFDSLENGKRVVLSRNESYFWGKPKLERVIFEKSNTENAINGFNTGYFHDLEWFTDVDPRTITTAYTMIKAPVPKVGELGFNLRETPFNDVHVRKAMMYALDRKKLVEECFPGRKVASGYIPPGIGGYYPEIQQFQYDLNKSKEELGKSKLSQKEIFRPLVILRPNNHPCQEQFGKIIESSFKKIGMQITVKHIPLDVLAARYYKPRDFDIFNLRKSADFPEALFLLNYFVSNHPDNYYSFKSKVFDELLNKASLTEDRYERYNLYRRAQEILQQEAVAIPLYYDVYEGVYQKNVRGVERPPYSSDTTSMKTVYFDGELGSN